MFFGVKTLNLTLSKQSSTSQILFLRNYRCYSSPTLWICLLWGCPPPTIFILTLLGSEETWNTEKHKIRTCCHISQSTTAAISHEIPFGRAASRRYSTGVTCHRPESSPVQKKRPVFLKEVGQSKVLLKQRGVAMATV